MSAVAQYPLHAVGSVGNASSVARDAGSDAEYVCLEVVIEAIGATPTVTIALEGSMDGTNFVACRHVPHDSETSAASQTYTTTGRRYLFLKSDLGAFFRFFRAVSSANTNVTFSTNLFTLDRD